MAWASQGVQAGSGGAELAVSGPLQATLPEDEGKGDTLYSSLIVKAWSFYKCKSIARPYVSGHPYNIWHPEALMQLSSSHECGLLQGEPQSSFLNNHPCSPNNFIYWENWAWPRSIIWIFFKPVGGTLGSPILVT